MWRPNEKKLFDAANTNNNTGHYKQALTEADALLVLVGRQPLKRAYVLGCRMAVALAHLGQYDKAEKAFEEAYGLAHTHRSWALVSYILTDWSGLKQGSKSLDKAEYALHFIRQAQETPDPERSLGADEAFCRANLARVYGQNNRMREAKTHIKDARLALRVSAYGLWPRYKHAYLVVYYWELRLYSKGLPWTIVSFARLLAAICLEAARQNKLQAFLRLLIKK